LKDGFAFSSKCDDFAVDDGLVRHRPKDSAWVSLSLKHHLREYLAERCVEVV
jgi:hypothetical protein